MEVRRGIFNGIFGNDDNDKKETSEEDAKLRLRKEELDIKKNRVQKGEVEFSKEIIEERKEIDVPVSEEIVDVGKHTVLTGEISAHKHSLEDTRHVDENLKRKKFG